MMYFILIFFLGCAVGSFVNVLIDRTIKNENWISGRSRCDHCHKNLAWYDMIPLISFAVYRGVSRCCQTPLSYRYPIVELLVGSLFLWWILVGFWFFRLIESPIGMIQPIFWLFSGVIVVVLGLADLFYGYVLMRVLWVGVGVTVLYRWLLWSQGFYQISDAVAAILASGVSYLFFWLLWKLTRGRGMAEGDMYMAMYTGILLGWPKGFVSILLSFVLGAIIGVGLIMFKIKTRKDTVPFLPFMVLSMGISAIWGQQIFGLITQ